MHDVYTRLLSPALSPKAVPTHLARLNHGIDNLSCPKGAQQGGTAPCWSQKRSANYPWGLVSRALGPALLTRWRGADASGPVCSASVRATAGEKFGLIARFSAPKRYRLVFASVCQRIFESRSCPRHHPNPIRKQPTGRQACCRLRLGFKQRSPGSNQRNTDMTDNTTPSEICTTPPPSETWFVQTRAPGSYWTIAQSFASADLARRSAQRLIREDQSSLATSLRLRSYSQWHQDDLPERIAAVAKRFADSVETVERERQRDIIGECLERGSFDYDDLAFYFACADLDTEAGKQPDLFVRLAYEISQAADRLTPDQITLLSKAFASLAMQTLASNLAQSDADEERQDAVTDWIPDGLFAA